MTNTNSSNHLTGLKDFVDPVKWSADIVDTNTWIGATAVLVIVLFCAWLTARIVGLAIHRYLDRAEQAGGDATGVRFLGKLTKVLIYIIGLIFYAHLVPKLNKLGTAGLTSVGLLSIVVGMAAQTTLGNLIAGISIVLYRPFKIGDELQVPGPKGVETGWVESINLGTTVLRTADNRRLIVPNNTMANQACINLSAVARGAPCSFSVTVINGAEVARARQILLDAAKTFPKISVNNCTVTALSGSGTTLTLDAWCEDTATAAQLKSDLMERAIKEFAAAGIKIA